MSSQTSNLFILACRIYCREGNLVRRIGTFKDGIRCTNNRKDRSVCVQGKCRVSFATVAYVFILFIYLSVKYKNIYIRFNFALKEYELFPLGLVVSFFHRRANKSKLKAAEILWPILYISTWQSLRQTVSFLLLPWHIIATDLSMLYITAQTQTNSICPRKK